MLTVMRYIIYSVTTVIFIKNKTKQKQRLRLRNLLKFIHLERGRITTQPRASDSKALALIVGLLHSYRYYISS